ncbi:GNAT family N-acetyltransferase [Pelistega sp. MC2]|uniref:GNAT family N-acetyltransferase n=1 Tax=Pelistega sp. MC2 TaxID=1720297 RepID=UPI0008D9BF04|nr:GNAT family N-acetyltransferase [Pelistega sp. MC2]
MMIRLLCEEDYPQWLSLWQDYLAFNHQTLALSITQHTWKNLTQSEVLKAWGAFSNTGELLAFIHIVKHPHTWSDRHCIYIEDLFVVASARRQGIARQLIETVYAYAKEHQCHRVYWVTGANNIQAQGLYSTLATKMDMIQYRKVVE